jgi:hypothetical protein
LHRHVGAHSDHSSRAGDQSGRYFKAKLFRGSSGDHELHAIQLKVRNVARIGSAQHASTGTPPEPDRYSSATRATPIKPS